MTRDILRTGALGTALLAIIAGCTASDSGASTAREEEGGVRVEEATGDFLGQGAPGSVPVPFAPGLVSTGYAERDIAMMPDGSEIYWGVVAGSFAWTTVMMSRRVGDRWTMPEVAPCCRDPHLTNLEPHISPDGKHFLWLSDRPGGALEVQGGQDIWVMDREGEAWGEPYPLPAAINTTDSEYFPSLTLDGTLYFTRGPAGGGENRIFRSRRVDGVYQEAELLPVQVNAGVNRYNAFVDPQERFVILTVLGLEGGEGSADYYIVFRTPDDEWSDPVNLGPAVNTPGGQEHSPYVSPDGRAFFFMTARTDWGLLAPRGELDGASIHGMMTEPNNGAWDIYWMDAAFLEELRPEGFSADTFQRKRSPLWGEAPSSRSASGNRSMMDGSEE